MHEIVELRLSLVKFGHLMREMIVGMLTINEKQDLHSIGVLISKKSCDVYVFAMQ